MKNQTRHFMGKRQWLFFSVIFCFLALFFQVTIPSLHLYLEALEPIDQVQESVLARAHFGIIQAMDESGHHHDESACPICKSLTFHHVSGTVTLPFILIIFTPLLIGILEFRDIHFEFLIQLIRASRDPPSLLV